MKNESNGIMSLYDAYHKFKNFQASEILKDDKEIISEWRIFVHNKKPIDIKNYNGDPFIMPEKWFIDLVTNLIGEQYKECTIDVAILKTGQPVIIEAHRFFSCELYGFSDLASLPIMIYRTLCDIKNLK